MLTLFISMLALILSSVIISKQTACVSFQASEFSPGKLYDAENVGCYKVVSYQICFEESLKLTNVVLIDFGKE
jgi:hypothetical protein